MTVDDERLQHARELVELSVLPLEVTAIAACTVELAHEIGVSTFAEALTPDNQQIIERRARLPLSVLSEHVEALQSAGLDEPETATMPPLTVLLRQAEAVVTVCPISDIEQAAELVDLEAQGHRCRVAYDALRALLRRQKNWDRTHTLGELYAGRQVSLSDCARILRMSPEDTVAEFERRGLWREAKVLADAERQQMLAAIRQDRLVRAGRAEPDRERARRSTVASERIEGIDAREWLRG